MDKWPTMVPTKEMIQDAVNYVIPNLHRFAQAKNHGTPNDRIRGHIAMLYCLQYFGIPDCNVDLEIDGEADDFDFKVGDRFFDVKSTWGKVYENHGAIPNSWTLYIPSSQLERDIQLNKKKDWYIRVVTDGEDPRNMTKMCMYCACHRTALEKVKPTIQLASKEPDQKVRVALQEDIFQVVHLWDLIEKYRRTGKWTGEERLFARRV